MHAYTYIMRACIAIYYMLYALLYSILNLHACIHADASSGNLVSDPLQPHLHRGVGGSRHQRLRAALALLAVPHPEEAGQCLIN